jgi:hypothetical protein
MSGLSVCDYTLERQPSGTLLVKSGASILKLSDHYVGHYHGVECHGPRLYWIRRPSGERGYLKDTLLIQNSMKGVGEEVFSCPGLDFRASESGDLMALRCGGEVAIKDMRKNELFKLFPKKTLVTPDVFKKSAGDDGPELIGIYGNRIFLGDATVGGWRQLCLNTWPESETKCSRVPFDGADYYYSIDPSGEYALFAARNFEDSASAGASRNERMEIYAFEFRSKRKALLTTQKMRPIRFEWPSDEVVTVHMEAINGPSSKLNADLLNLKTKDIKTKLQTVGKVWSASK